MLFSKLNGIRLTRLVPCAAASVDYVDTSTDFRLRIRNLRPVVARLQDRTIRQLKEEAQHLSKLGVRHVLDGWVLASLWRLCILCDTVLVFGCLAVPSARSARCLLLVEICATVDGSRGRTCPRHLHGLQCSVLLPICGGIVYGILGLCKFHLCSKRPGISTYSDAE